MKVINRSEFLKIEGKVLYSRFYNGHVSPSSSIEMKLGNNGDNDWVYQTLSGEIARGFDVFDEAWESNIDSLDIDLECAGRDGMFDSDEKCKFLIFEKKDVMEIISKLNEFF